MLRVTRKPETKPPKNPKQSQKTSFPSCGVNLNQNLTYDQLTLINKRIISSC